jgi:excisionase family DNA binding protein
MTLIERLKARKKPMTVKEVAEELGYHIMTIYDWTREGKIPFSRPPRRMNGLSFKDPAKKEVGIFCEAGANYDLRQVSKWLYGC